VAVVCSDHGETPLYIAYKTENQFLNAVSCVCNGSVCCWEESENTQKPRNHYRISAATRVANTPSPPRPAGFTTRRRPPRSSAHGTEQLGGGGGGGATPELGGGGAGDGGGELAEGEGDLGF